MRIRAANTHSRVRTPTACANTNSNWHLVWKPKTCSSASEPAADKKQLYRVRKTWADSKSQKGAFSVLANAKKCADSNKGYSVFDENGRKVYPADSSTAKKSVDTIAREVIRGDWGNGDERKKKLTADRKSVV